MHAIKACRYYMPAYCGVKTACLNCVYITLNSGNFHLEVDMGALAVRKASLKGHPAAAVSIGDHRLAPSARLPHRLPQINSASENFLFIVLKPFRLRSSFPLWLWLHSGQRGGDTPPFIQLGQRGKSIPNPGTIMD